MLNVTWGPFGFREKRIFFLNNFLFLFDSFLFSSIYSFWGISFLIFNKWWPKLGVFFNDWLLNISFAYKTGKSSQLSLAYGDFFQQPESEVLKFTNSLEAQHTQHYIMNYQYSANNRIFRAEIYRKQYTNLVTYNDEFPDVNTTFLNNGDGYAQGLDLFWCDNNSIKKLL